MKAVGIIGVGRVGTALARGLKEAGYQVRFLASLPSRQATEIAPEIGAKAIPPPYIELAEAEIVFLAVPDEAIARVAAELAASGIDWRGKTALHCSGALTSNVLAPLRAKGTVCASLHPLQTFPPGCGSERFKGVHFAAEGDDVETALEIAEALGGTGAVIKSSDKALYHAAACLAGNGIAALAAAGRELLRQSGFRGEEDWRMLLPLMQGTLDSLAEFGIEKGLTGPIARGETEVVRQQLEKLSERLEFFALYQALAMWILEIAELNENKRLDMLQILAEF